jgi:hypothetical protein
MKIEAKIKILEQGNMTLNVLKNKTAKVIVFNGSKTNVKKNYSWSLGYGELFVSFEIFNPESLGVLVDIGSGVKYGAILTFDQASKLHNGSTINLNRVY